MSGTIYVVDDSADYRFLLQQVFVRFLPQYAVRFFTSGNELYQHAQGQLAAPDRSVTPPPSLILMDLNMPGFSGLQTLQLLKSSSWRGVPVVIMTNDQSDQQRTQCYNAGVNSVIIKPESIDAIRHTLDLTCHYWVDINCAAPPPIP